VTRRHRLPITILVVLTIVTAAAACTSGGRDDATEQAPVQAAPTTAPSSAPPTTTTRETDVGPPYPVGVVHTTMVDPTRGVDARGPTPAAAERTLPLTIRYPAATGTASSADVPDAPARGGPRTLVVFAHGLALTDQTYPRFLHDLAAAGFVVADPEFPLSSGVLPGPARSDPVAQATDLAFVADRLLDPVTRPTVLRPVGLLDRIAAMGHSDGGITAAGFAGNSCCADPRVGAAVILAGALGRFSGGWFTTVAPPLLVVHGTADTTNPVSSSRSVYAASPGPKLLALVEGGSHIGAFEDDVSRPAVVMLIADFLRAHLLNDTAAASRVDADANVPGVLTSG
jgi:alpha-beta hydrolase superfamily lysophospholipase